MNTQLQHAYFTPEEYLELERRSPFKHEYQHGLIYVMAGTKRFHVQIASNLHILLGVHLRKTPCSIYESDMKVQIETANCYYYPDILVTCDKHDLEGNKDFISSPSLIIEVLSKSTEQFDRTEKFLDYQQIPALQEYILVSQEKVQVECYRKQATGEWISHCYGVKEIVEILSIDFKCPIEEIYNKVLGIIV